MLELGCAEADVMALPSADALPSAVALLSECALARACGESEAAMVPLPVPDRERRGTAVAPALAESDTRGVGVPVPSPAHCADTVTVGVALLEAEALAESEARTGVAQDSGEAVREAGSEGEASALGETAKESVCSSGGESEAVREALALPGPLLGVPVNVPAAEALPIGEAVGMPLTELLALDTLLVVPEADRRGLPLALGEARALSEARALAERLAVGREESLA